MLDPSPELGAKIKAAYARTEPKRVFHGCKSTIEGDQTFVRIYSSVEGQKRVMPTPYEIFRFDPSSEHLSPASKEEALRFSIPNYK